MEQVVKLHFDEPSHKYSIEGTNKYFTSVTTVIEQYSDEFNSRYWAMWTGLKNAGIKLRFKKENEAKGVINVNGINTSINSLYQNSLFASFAANTKLDWKQKTDASHVRGNKIHNYLEDTINESGDKKVNYLHSTIKPLSEEEQTTALTIFKTVQDLDTTDLEEVYIDIYNYLKDLILQGFVLIAEKKIYTVTHMIAGMIDVLAIKYETKEFMIVDWKSNKDKMHFTSGYYPKVKGEDGKYVKGTEFVKRDDRLKIPLDNLQKCKGIKYSLQLSLYAYIMELWGYKLIMNGLTIFHIRPRRKPLLIKVAYLREDIIRMLQHFNNVNQVSAGVDKTPKFTGFGISK